MEGKKYFKKGFTLIELLVVISIIGLLGSVVLSATSSAKDKAKLANVRAFDAQLKTSEGADAVVSFDFNEGVGTVTQDISGFNSNGTITGATWSNDTVSGSGTSLYFNGSNYVRIPYNSNMLFDQKGFTYSVWVKPTAYPSSYNMIMGQHLPYLNIGCGSNSGRIHLSMTAGGSQRSVCGASTVSLSSWHHVAASYDSAGYMKVFLDGKLDGTAGPFTPPTSYSVYDLYVGQWNSGGTYRFTGNIDDVRYYNHALDVAEINKIYAEGKERHFAGI